jgi:hypothetical protein
MSAFGREAHPITKEAYDAYFELSFSPNRALIPTVRRFVSDFYTEVLKDAELTSRLVLAAHELLENAVTYSADGHTTMSIGVRRQGSALEVAIDTRNATSGENLAILETRFGELTAAVDPSAHYLELMRRSAKRPTGSGLGLGRVCAEADMWLAYRLDDSGGLYVCARGRYVNQPPPKA